MYADEIRSYVDNHYKHACPSTLAGMTADQQETLLSRVTQEILYETGQRQAQIREQMLAELTEDPSWEDSVAIGNSARRLALEAVYHEKLPPLEAA